jgi:glycosyltransferase involved in cell wall biosynthesis
MPAPSLSVIVPVYNEERTAPAMVSALRQLLEERGGEWELLLVDNASSDRTREVLAPLLGERVRLLRNESNRGKGYSVRRGMLEARGELRLMCDVDCEPSLPSLPRLLELSGEYDVVIGSRAARDAEVDRHQPLRRRAFGLGFLLLCRSVMSEPARDIFCGFKVYSADAAEAVFSRVRIEGWVFDAEALALARALGYRVREVGIRWTHRPDSRLSMRRVVGPALRELLAARRHVRREARLAAAAGELAPRRAETRA